MRKEEFVEYVNKLKDKVLREGKVATIVTKKDGEKYQVDEYGLTIESHYIKKRQSDDKSTTIREDKAVVLNLVTYTSPVYEKDRQILEMVSLHEGTAKGYRFAVDLSDGNFTLFNEAIGLRREHDNRGLIINETNVGAGKSIPNETSHLTFVRTAKLVLKNNVI